MKRTAIQITTFLILSGFSQSTFAQESSTSNDTWYVWVDTEVPINNKMVRIVSGEPMTITCCPKSAKYRKFVKKTAKWLVQNVSADYNGELSLMKIQDQDLAYQTIAALKEREDVLVVNYTAECK